MSSPEKRFTVAPVPRRGSLADEIVAVLRERLVSGEMDVGAKLPAESRLAEAFQVSRAIIREALARLKQEGLVESQQGRGVFVLRSGPAPKAPLGLHAPGVKLKHIYELRLAVEPVMCSLAAAQATPELAAALDAAMQSLRAVEGRSESGPDADHAFHLAIARASGNPLFVSLLEYIGKDMIAAIRMARDNTDKVTGRSQLVLQEHEAIFEAIRSGDAGAAAEAMRRHLGRAAARLSVAET